MDITNLALMNEIRAFCSLKRSNKSFFTRVEMKKIASKINRRARMISDNQGKSTYCSAGEIFPKYLSSFWVEQETANTHPHRANLLNIYKELAPEPVEAVEPQQNALQIEVEAEIPKNNPNISEIFNMLPDVFKNRAKTIYIKSADLTITIKMED
jgi:hypothetical protein